jgi:hypothetical protein
MNGGKVVLAVFKENPERKGIFDLAKKADLPFQFFKLEKPRSTYLKRRKAKAVIQSWNTFGAKILHTGLIQVAKDWYFGDNFGEETHTRKDFIVAHFRRTTKGNRAFLIFYFIGVEPLDKVGATREVETEWLKMEKVKAAR